MVATCAVGSCSRAIWTERMPVSCRKGSWNASLKAGPKGPPGSATTMRSPDWARAVPPRAALAARAPVPIRNARRSRADENGSAGVASGSLRIDIRASSFGEELLHEALRLAAGVGLLLDADPGLQRLGEPGFPLLAEAALVEPHGDRRLRGQEPRGLLRRRHHL